MYHKPLRYVVGLIILVGILSVASLGSAVRATGLRAPSPTPSKFVPLPEPKRVKFDSASVAKIDVMTLPVIPEITGHTAAIYAEGQRRGNNPRIFSKVGDCMTATPDFLEPIYKKDYALDQYTSLQKVIDHFAGVPARGKDAEFDSFGNPSLAATSGFNAASVLDATWSDPKWCKGDESPLSCEFRVSKPAFALIMFGTNDLKSITADDYDYFLRRVIVQTANAGVVPILSTFPTQPGLEDASKLYNQITVKVAADYDVPLINLSRALSSLPHLGVDPVETTHMTKPASGKSASFAEADLQFGYNARNLVTLQTLEAILKVVQPDALK